MSNSMEAGVAYVSILPSAKGFGRDLNKQISSETSGTGDTAGKSVGRSMGSSLLRTIGGLGIGIGIGKTIGTGMQTAMDSELANIKFTQLLGSADKAKAFITDLQDFAKKTPFDFPGLQDAAGKLVAVGVSAENVIPLMTSLGDVIGTMGGTSDDINGVTTALGQMQMKGKVTAEEMQQMAERNVPAWDILAEHMGISTEEAMNLSQKGLIPAQEMFEALQDTSTETLGQMSGGMERASQTLQGQWDTLKDTATTTLGNIFANAIPLLTSGLDWFTGTLIPGVAGFADAVMRWKTPIMVVVGIIAAIFLPLLVAWAIQMVITAATTVGSFLLMSAQAIAFAAIMAAQWIIAFWPVFLVIAIVIALVAVIWYFWDEIKAALGLAWDWVKSVFTGIWDAITGAFTAIWDFIQPLWDTLWSILTLPVRIWWTVVSAVFQLAWAGIKFVFEKIAGFVVPIWQGIWDAVQRAVQAVVGWITPKLTAVKDFIVGVFTTVKDKVTGIWGSITGVIQRAADVIAGIGQGIWNGLKGTINFGIGMLNTAIRGFNGLIGAVNKVPGVNVSTIPEIPKLADGGIVTRPTLALVGEAGPEAVIPLSRYGRGPGPGPMSVRVFIGERELTDIVRVEVEAADEDTAGALTGGRRT
jgi:tape measure domain-containing protein